MNNIKASMRRSMKLVTIALTCLAPMTISSCVAVNVEGYTDNPNFVKGQKRAPKKTLELSPAAMKTAAGYDASMEYLLNVRYAMLKKAQNRDKFDTGTKIGQDIGLFGAIAKSITSNPASPMLSFLTFGALSMKANNDVNPLLMAKFYRLGAANLDCVRSSSVLMHDEIDRIQKNLSDGQDPAKPFVFDKTVKGKAIREAIAKVNADIIALQQGADDGDLEATQNVVDGATSVVRVAEDTLVKLEVALDEVKLGNGIVDAVRQTETAVDLEAYDKTPSPERILASVDGFKSFLAIGAGIRGDVTDAKTKISQTVTSAAKKADSKPDDNKNKALVEARKSTAKLKAELIRDLNILRGKLSMLPIVSTDATLAAISQCKYSASALAAVKVSKNPVAIQIGKPEATVTITGKGPFSIVWEAGTNPEGVVASIKGDELRIQATEKAAVGSAKFYIYDNGTAEKSATVVLNIAAKEAATAPPPPDPTPTPTPTPPPTPTPTPTNSSGSEGTPPPPQ